MKKILSIILVIYLYQYSFAQTKIEIGEKYKIHSVILDEEREYWVSVPSNYNDSIYAPQEYPVVYFLDGDRHFHSLTGIHEFLSKGPYGMLPEMIFVGILTTKNRARDLTPTEVKESQLGQTFKFPNTGGNTFFLDFLEKELMPFINKKYRTNGYKTLIGHSFGGLTVLNTLLSRSELFNAYIAIDPSVWWDNKYVLQQAKKKLKTKDYTNKRLFISQGYDEPTPKDTARWHERAIQSFRQVLENDHQSGLQWSYQFFENDDHGTVSLPSEYYGLRYIFKGYQLPVKMVAQDPSIVKRNFNKISKNLGFNIKPEEARIDWIANYCIEIGRIENGIELLKLNQQYYPNSVNTYKSLGKAYLKVNDVNKAKKQFLKGLEVNPSDVFLIQKVN
ncbi:alpha/beta hydrolase-fold protein [Wenyingzhuangia sp. IMCC45467]